MPNHVIYDKDTGEILRVVYISENDDPKKQLRSGQEKLLEGVKAKKFDKIEGGKVKKDKDAEDADKAARDAERAAEDTEKERRDAQDIEFEARLIQIRDGTSTPNNKFFAEILLELLTKRIPKK
jgi:hypothetical protein